MPEVKTFSLSSFAGYNNIDDRQPREPLLLARPGDLGPQLQHDARYRSEPGRPGRRPSPRQVARRSRTRRGTSVPTAGGGARRQQRVPAPGGGWGSGTERRQRPRRATTGGACSTARVIVVRSGPRGFSPLGLGLALSAFAVAARRSVKMNRSPRLLPRLDVGRRAHRGVLGRARSGGLSARAATAPSPARTASSIGGSPARRPERSSGAAAGAAAGSSSVPAPPSRRHRRGPGSTSSPAHSTSTRPSTRTCRACQACHSSGVDGAPKMMVAPADNTYSELDRSGSSSRTACSSPRARTTSARPPRSRRSSSPTSRPGWGWRRQERAGRPHRRTSWRGRQVREHDRVERIGWSKLDTQPRTNENPNKCTGLQQGHLRLLPRGRRVRVLHGGRDGAPAGGDDVQDDVRGPDRRTTSSVLRLNGTTPVASNAIMLKMQAVAAGRPTATRCS